MQLVKYDEACRAVADCKRIDEVQQIKGKAEALRAYAKQAKNRELEIDASEIRVRAERRIGELVARIKLETKFAPRSGRSLHPEFSYSDVGIDKEMKRVCSRLASLPDDKFERAVSMWREEAETSVRRITLPLQHVRVPLLIKHNKCSAAARKKKQIEAGALDAFCALDGRPIEGWRIGELNRLEAVTLEQLNRIKALRNALPVANDDPFRTMKEVYGCERLARLLSESR